MKETIKKYFLFALIFIIITVLICFMKWKLNPGQKLFVIHDTTIITKYKNELRRDTVVKWMQKLIYKKSEPVRITVQNTDTVFIEGTKNMDLILQVKKEKDKVIIKAIDQNGKIFKELIYEDIGNDFTATSIKNNVVLKSKKFYWNGLNATADFDFPLKEFIIKRPNIKFGLNTGINYLDKIFINAGFYYSNYDRLIIPGFGINYKFMK